MRVEAHPIFKPEKDYMAKKAKVRKKRKYTRRRNNENQVSKNVTDNFNQFNPNGGDLGRGTEVTVTEKPRASVDSYVFVDACRMPIRNLNDLKLNQLATDVYNELTATRMRVETLSNVWSNMSMEQRYRGLK